jgi:diacylglycerol kinase (ATP)
VTRPLHERIGHALRGLSEAWRDDGSLRTLALLGLPVLALMAVLRPSATWWALVGGMGALLVSAELFNSALERLADHVHPGRHEQIRRVKDVAAAAVLVLALGGLCVVALAVVSTLG